MKFNITYTYLGSLWDFAERLSGWHFSYNRREIDDWLSFTGALSEKEVAALEVIKVMGQEHNEDNDSGDSWLLDRAFITNSEAYAWKAVHELIGDGQAEKLRAAIKVMEPRFGKLWPDDEERLRQRKAMLKQGLSNAKSAEICEILSSFFQPDNAPEEVSIYLLSNGQRNGMQGGANLGPGEITLRCSRTEPISYERMAGPIWHETTHLYQQKHYLHWEKKFLAKVKKPAKWQGGYPLYSAFREATVSSLVWPYGYVASNMLGIEQNYVERYGADFEKLDPRRLYDWGYVFAPLHLQAVTKGYAEDHQSIDEDYLNAVLEVWEQYLAHCENLN